MCDISVRMTRNTLCETLRPRSEDGQTQIESNAIHAVRAFDGRTGETIGVGLAVGPKVGALYVLEILDGHGEFGVCIEKPQNSHERCHEGVTNSRPCNLHLIISAEQESITRAVEIRE